MLYTTIKGTEFLFEDLEAETPYSFKVRAANRDGHSAWTAVSAKTKANPLEFAIPGIEGETSVETRAAPWRSCLISRKRMCGTRSMMRRLFRLTWSWT